jgi:hypothetical protein
VVVRNSFSTLRSTPRYNPPVVTLPAKQSWLYWPIMAAIVVCAVLAYLVSLLLLPLASVVLLLAGLDRKLRPDNESPNVLTGLVFPAGMILNIVVLPIGICWLSLFGEGTHPAAPNRHQA